MDTDVSVEILKAHLLFVRQKEVVGYVILVEEDGN